MFTMVGIQSVHASFDWSSVTASDVSGATQTELESATCANIQSMPVAATAGFGSNIIHLPESAVACITQQAAGLLSYPVRKWECYQQMFSVCLSSTGSQMTECLA